jgi:arylsulfatase A-like enzyme
MKQTIFIIVIMALIAGCQSPEKKAERRPNIIVIMSDDHARNAISAYGSTLINTPNIDRIAKEGFKFNNAFVTNALCGPSRAVMLTGKHSHLNGFRDNNDRFDGGQVTVSKLLQKAGYHTSVIGKWHLVSEPTGFDYWNVLIDQGQYYNPDFVEMGDTSRITGYTTEVTTDIVLKKLAEMSKDKPFFMMLNHKAPHRNWLPNLKDLDMFSGDTIPIPDNFFDDYATRSDAAREQDMEVRKMFWAYDLKLILPKGVRDPGTGGSGGDADGAQMWTHDYNRFTDEQRKIWDEHFKPIADDFFKRKLKGKELAEWMYQRYIQDYLSCVASVDENVGRVLDYLEKNNLSDNTIVIYTSDQGFFLGEHGWYDKRFMYEESMGTPLMVRFPQKITVGVSDQLVSNLDIAPTLLDLAGVDVPGEMQGRSLVPLMSDTPAKEWRSAVYYHYYEYPYGAHNVKKHYGIRTERYKLIHFYNDIDAWELYDLKTDPHEMNNVAGNPEYAAVTDSLKIRLYELKAAYLDTAAIN